MLNLLSRQKHTDWIIRQLDLLPHQHLLEAGFRSGRLLAAVASQLHNNFLAAVEPSLTLYHQAVRRNENVIRQAIVQLHHGHVCDLPYPAGYFHRIYASGSYYSWQNIFSECLRLGNLLRTGGKLVLVSQPGRYHTEEDLRTEAARLQAAYQNAGLTDIHTEYGSFPNGKCIAVSGSRLSNQIDYQHTTRINNRLLNPGAYFISNMGT
jgi:cyclopropane fatty-acyl-phospholipid synthase-like methyltransferase